MNPFSFLCFVFFCIRSSAAIINGFPANPIDIRSQVSVLTRFPDGTINVCGGVLIAPSLVLTSAHCVFIGQRYAITAKIGMGVHLSSRGDDEQEFWSHAVAVPRKFQNGSKDANDDVAIVFLPNPASVCLASFGNQIAKLWSTPYLSLGARKTLSNAQLESSVCYVAGWGRTENEAMSYSEVARQMMVTLTVRRLGSKSYLLAKGISGGSRACTGDSGSPVFCFIDGQRTLIGTVAQIGSFGKKSPSNPSEETSFCRDFEYVFLSDWRESSRRIVEILETYAELEQLEEGQKLCHR